LTPEEYAGWIISALIVGAVVFGIMRWFYKRGVKDTEHSMGSNNTHADIYNKINTVESTIDRYAKKNEQDHKLFFDKFAAIKADVGETKSNVSYIKGRIDQALGKK